MIPNNSISQRSVLTPMMYPDNSKFRGLMDAELGGVAIGDASQGMETYIWNCEVEANGDVKLTRNGASPIVVYNLPDVVDVSFCFDQNMRVQLAWETSQQELFFYHWDSLANAYAVMPLGTGKTPRLTLDDKREVGATTSDVLCVYIKNNALVYRQQRDAYLQERILISTLPASTELMRVGMGGYQLQFHLLG